MEPTPLIPLFPLAIVALPGQPVSLHIFEERYKTMVIDCSPGRTDAPFAPFGICLQLGSDVEKVGCTAVVTEITERYADGSFDIVTRADRRYTTVRTFEDRPYLTGEVEYFDDIEGGGTEPGLRDQVEARHLELLDLAAREAGVGEAAARPDETEEPPDSFAMAARVAMALKQKQRLLELRSETERLEHLATYLDQALPQYRERVERKHRAKGNGHSKEL